MRKIYPLALKNNKKVTTIAPKIDIGRKYFGNNSNFKVIYLTYGIITIIHQTPSTNEVGVGQMDKDFPAGHI